MKIIKQQFEFIDTVPNGEKLERCGRVCYQSTMGQSENFVAKIVKNKHHSVLEHISLTAHIITNRAILAEITRHRLASFSVESTRYCNYSKDKFGNEVKFILPSNISPQVEAKIIRAYSVAEKDYLMLLELGAKPEEARDILPMGLAVEMYMTANLREWKHIIELRTDKAAHPQARELFEQAKAQLSAMIPELFEETN